MIGFPNAKINLGLNILARREDGFHNISTCFYPVQWCDILEIVPVSRGKTSITETGTKISEINVENICLKAYRLMKKDFDIPEVNIYLHKQIPVGSGLGGGSSDGAETLKIIDKMFNLFLDQDLLAWYALKLGSDCPFFIFNKPVIASGRGEEMEEININLMDKAIVIIHPGFPVSTAEAFRNCTPRIPEIPLSEIIKKHPLEDWKEILKNDFEDFVLEKYPALKKVKMQLYEAGAWYVSLTGSGSGIYGIFNELPKTIPSFPADYKIWSGLL